MRGLVDKALLFALLRRGLILLGRGDIRLELEEVVIPGDGGSLHYLSCPLNGEISRARVRVGEGHFGDPLIRSHELVVDVIALLFEYVFDDALLEGINVLLLIVLLTHSEDVV